MQRIGNDGRRRVILCSIIVAILALLKCVCNGYQGAMMAPTEVLAKQHYETVCGYCNEYIDLI